MHLLLQTIEIHLAPALMVIFRLGGLTIFGPVLGSSLIPVRTKVFLSFLLGLSIYPLVSTSAGFEMNPELNLWALVPMIGLEITLGALIGFMASIPLLAAETGGLIMGQQIGLGFARFYNPAIDDEGDLFGQFLFLMTLAGFLMIGGHEQLILAVMHSFEHVPPGGFVMDAGIVPVLTGLLLASFEMALRIAAPLLALIFLETIAMGFLAKTVPQLNILSLGFPLRIMVGLFIIMIGLVAIDQVMMEGIDELMNVIFGWIESN